MSRDNPELTDDDYAELLRFRDALRHFLHWSEQQARSVGLTPAHHQLLLAVRGHGHDPTTATSPATSCSAPTARPSSSAAPNRPACWTADPIPMTSGPSGSPSAPTP